MTIRLNSVAQLFAATFIPPAAGDHGTIESAFDGMITVERASSVLGVSRADAVQVLVCLRTFLHNRFLAQAGGRAAAPSAFASDAALEVEAAAMLAANLDEIDEVFVQLDARVVEGSAQTVTYDNAADREERLVHLAATLNAHEAAWLALRPRSVPPAAERFEGSVAQLELPLVFDPREADSLASDSCPRPQRRSSHQQRMKALSVASSQSNIARTVLAPKWAGSSGVELNHEAGLLPTNRAPRANAGGTPQQSIARERH